MEPSRQLQHLNGQMLNNGDDAHKMCCLFLIAQAAHCISAHLSVQTNFSVSASVSFSFFFFFVLKCTSQQGLAYAKQQGVYLHVCSSFRLTSRWKGRLYKRSCVCASFFFLLRTEKGQVLPQGSILNTLACAKNVDILTKKKPNNKPLKAFCVLSKATVMHIRTQDVLGVGVREGRGWNGGVDKQHSEKDWEKTVEEQRGRPYLDLFLIRKKKWGDLFFMHQRVANIGPIWLSDNTLHLISGH